LPVSGQGGNLPEAPLSPDNPAKRKGMNMLFDGIIVPLFTVVHMALDLYVWVLIISAVLSWLVAFNILNTRSRVVYVIGDVLNRLTEPVLRHIRRFVPVVGGMDLSPLALIFIVIFLQLVIQRLFLS
jgi:YggT family protein